MAIRLSKSLASKVSFARFCMEHNCDPGTLAQLIAHAKRSVTAYERNDTEGENKHGSKVEELGAELGFKVSWSGLYPTLSKGGYDYFLPG